LVLFKLGRELELLILGLLVLRITGLLLFHIGLLLFVGLVITVGLVSCLGLVITVGLVIGDAVLFGIYVRPTDVLTFESINKLDPLVFE
tara:strand:+ start:202 stop:468 length:267 start_codon:yes stop_codon:yes gene_type:complete